MFRKIGTLFLGLAYLLILMPFDAYSREVRPEDYGAEGDGIIDDTEAVQKAIDSSDKIILSGTYLCHLLTIDHDVEIFGGVLKSHLDDGGNTSPLLRSQGRYNLTFRETTFDGAVLTGAKCGVESRLFLDFEGQKNILFDRCTIRNHGIISKAFADCWYLRNNYALRILGVRNVEFRNCEIYANREECICIGSNVDVQTKKLVTKLIVKDCISHDNDKPGSQALFLLFNLKSGVFENCSFKDQGTAFINSMSSNVQVVNCSFENTPNRAITSEDLGAYYNCRNMRIVNNIIRNCKEAAISVGNEDILISGNTIENCGIEAGVYVGRLICGENFYGNVAKKAIPYFDGSFKSNKNGRNIRIEDNIINDSSQVGVLVYCNYLSEEGSIAIKEFGTFSNVSICNNVISNTFTPIQFGNGFYKNVNISNNELKVKESTPIFLTTSNVPRFKGMFEGLTVEGNFVSADKPLEYLMVIGNATTTKLRVKNNVSDKLVLISEYNQIIK